MKSDSPKSDAPSQPSIRDLRSAVLKTVPIEDSFDLHSFLPRDVPSALGEYLDQARERGLREVRIIHGKGTGMARAQVRRLLESRQEIAAFFDAPPERGGFGATVAILGDPSRR